MTVFVSSSAGLLSVLEMVSTAGCESSLIHLQLRHWQLSVWSPVQFNSLAISFARIYCDSKSRPQKSKLCVSGPPLFINLFFIPV